MQVKITALAGTVEWRNCSLVSAFSGIGEDEMLLAFITFASMLLPGSPPSRAKANVSREVEALASTQPVTITDSMTTMSGMAPRPAAWLNVYRKANPDGSVTAALTSGMAKMNDMSTMKPTKLLR